MRFIIDAQLPPSWVEILRSDGRDAVHTSQLKEGNTTSDETILEVAQREDRIVILILLPVCHKRTSAILGLRQAWKYTNSSRQSVS